MIALVWPLKYRELGWLIFQHLWGLHPHLQLCGLHIP